MRSLKRSLKLMFKSKHHSYFPPITQNERSLIYKAVRESASDELKKLELCSDLSKKLSIFTPFDFKLEETFVTTIQDGRVIAFPRPIPSVKFTLLVYGYLSWLNRKYSLPGFCEVEMGDRVMDCGAYVGGFCMSIASKASRIDCFEPEPTNYRALNMNIRNATNTFAHQGGLYSTSGSLKLNMSESSVEHSFLAPDDGATEEVVEVDTIRLDAFAQAEGIAEIDFLKIEAEGVEIEVYLGIGDLPVKKLAIDVSPERDGRSPRDYFEKTLSNKGYEVRVRGDVLFAKRRDK